jgi:hypothetical protein
MPGANAPAASCAMEKAHELVTTGSPANAGIPCASGFTAYSVLFPVIGLVVTVPAQRKALSRVNASVETSEPHGFAVRSSLARLAKNSGHRFPSRVRDDREPPLVIGTGCAKA